MKPPVVLQHSHKPTTVEILSLSPFLQNTLKILIGLHFSTALGLLVAYGYASSYCNATSNVYVGITAFLSSVHLVFAMLSAISLYLNIKLLTYAVVVLSFVMACIIMINESFTYLCTQEDIYDSDYGVCNEFRTSTNLCNIIPQNTIKSSALKYQHQVPRWIHVISVLLALFTLCSIIGIIVILSFTLKAGNPVYLAKKRHKGSIMVGEAKNVELARENKIMNLETTTAVELEKEWYRKRTVFEIELDKLAMQAKLDAKAVIGKKMIHQKSEKSAVERSIKANASKDSDASSRK